MPISEITRIVRKRSGGEALTPEEKEVLRVYYRKYSRSKQALHLKGGRRIEWLELADRQGLSFSSWAQERIVEAMSGPGPIVDELRTENQRLRDEVASLRGTTGQLSVENSRMHARLEAMEPVLVEAAQLAKQLAGRQ